MTTLCIYKPVLLPTSPGAHPMATYCHRVELKGEGGEGRRREQEPNLEEKREERRRETKTRRRNRPEREDTAQPREKTCLSRRRHCPAQGEDLPV